MMDTDDPNPLSASEHRAEIARVRKEIARAKQVYLYLDHSYHGFSDAQYIRVTKVEASRVVGMMPEYAEPFKLKWIGDKLYIPPAYYMAP